MYPKARSSKHLTLRAYETCIFQTHSTRANNSCFPDVSTGCWYLPEHNAEGQAKPPAPRHFLKMGHVHLDADSEDCDYNLAHVLGPAMTLPWHREPPRLPRWLSRAHSILPLSPWKESVQKSGPQGPHVTQLWANVFCLLESHRTVTKELLTSSHSGLSTEGVSTVHLLVFPWKVSFCGLLQLLLEGQASNSAACHEWLLQYFCFHMY